MPPVNTEFLTDVLRGLCLPEKAIAPKWLYDARGSELFEAITETEDYYVTRTEAAIMPAVYDALHRLLPPGSAIAEFGSGAGIKSRRLLEAIKPSVYVMIDVAEEFLAASRQTMHSLYPDVDVYGVVGDFSGSVALPRAFLDAPSRMGFFPGSTIGNFDKGGAEEFLRRSRASLGDGARFLVGADLVKDDEVLLAAYDDSDGVTRQFTLNLLERMKRELDADIDLSGFEAIALWNPAEERMELGCVANGPQTIRVGGQTFEFDDGDMIHTENSHKFTKESLAGIADPAGWDMEAMWTDERQWFGVFLLKAR